MNKPVSLSSVTLDRAHSTRRAPVEEVSSREVAIIGMAARLPGDAGIDEFWRDLCGGLEGLAEPSQERKRDIEAYLRCKGEGAAAPAYMKGAFLREIDTFDYGLFRITPKEASLMNPIQRLFLETAWAAFEDAGYPLTRLSGSRTGVYLGLINEPETSRYQEIVQAADPSAFSIAVGGNLVSIFPSRVSYFFNLKGPSMVVDSACSSSLVALHLACQALWSGECDMALAGGARVLLMPVHREEQKIGFESLDERTRTFDESASGSGAGEGVIAFILKPLHHALRDGDPIHAVIKGSATNQDGASFGITAPNPEAQSELLMAAWRDAGIDPESLGYIEAHGTATRLGDPIELDGIERAFRRFTQKRQFCAIGSVKANVGHLYASSGLAGVLKAVQSLKHGVIPPHPNFERPNTRIDFSQSPVYVNLRLTRWEAGTNARRCGVSSFGLSGTNCHVVLEEAPRRNRQVGRTGLNALLLSARSDTALRRLVARYRTWLEEAPDLDLRQVCYTAAVGREHHTHRLVVMARDLAELRQRLFLLEKVGPQVVQEPGIHAGVHKMVAADEGGRSGELSPADWERLAARAKAVLEQYLAGNRQDEGLLEQLCSLHVAGAAVQWEEIYRDERLCRVNLPTYPFDPTRCWVDLPTGEMEEAKAAVVLPAGGLPDEQQRQLFYATRWSLEELMPGPIADGQSGTVLLVSRAGVDTTSLVDALHAHGGQVLEAVVGDDFRPLDEGRWQVSGSEADYRNLWEAVYNRGVRRIVHLLPWADRTEVTDTASLEAALEQGVLALYRLVRALPSDTDLDLLVVTHQAVRVDEHDQNLFPQHAVVQGLANVVRKEMPQVHSRCLDLDEASGLLPVAAELYSGRDPRVAYRQGARYVEQFGPAEPLTEDRQAVTIRDEGVYLITGGLGGMGLELARYLVARNSRVKIALLGRSALPSRENWDAVLEGEGGSRAARAIAAIREMEAKGAEIWPVSADVADPDRMAGVVAMLRERYGRINGVIHAAGIGVSTLLVDRAETDFRALLAPKVTGTWLLDQLTRCDPPDLFVLCSSVASIFSAPTQGDYAAANAFLDAYADYRTAQGLHSLAINWVTWKETGMAADAGIAYDTMFKTLSTHQALAAFDMAMRRTESRLLIGEINREGFGARLMLGAGVRLTEALAAQLTRSVSATERKRSATNPSRSRRTVRLTGRSSEAYSAMERTLAEICRDTLGYEDVDVNQNFFEMGADSILLTRMAKQIDERFPGQVQMTDLFQYATIAKLADHLVGEEEGAFTGVEQAERPAPTNSGDIAIIGMAARLPQADTLEDFWELLRGGADCVVRFPPQRRQDIDRYMTFKGFSLDETTYLDGAYLSDIDKFDFNFFRIPPREANFIDPHQRLFLETAWQAIEDAGYGGGKLAGSATGVYLGFTTNVRDMYAKILYDIDPGSMSQGIVGNATSVAAGRISYILDLRGPSMVVDTACSSALVALDAACQSIRNGQCEAALVGGIKLITVPMVLQGQAAGIGMEAHDSITRTFDHYAQGTAFGEGVEVILVKSLDKAIEDGDHIYAVIKGSAVNQDGSSAGLTAPNPESQVDVLLKAWEKAGIDPETLSYIEAHGTATPLGDPIEMRSLQTAFRRFTDKRHFCSVGSVKSNLGHLSEGAGLVGLIKCVLAMQHGELPGSLHFNRPSDRISLIDSPLFVNTRPCKWDRKGGPRRCGVSAFGMSGTNCHVVLEEYLAPTDQASDQPQGPFLFTLSSRTAEGLVRLINRYSEFCTKQDLSWISDICCTAATGRGHYSSRLALLVRDGADLRNILSSLIGTNLRDLRAPGIWYGEHKIVPEHKESRAAGEMSGPERDELTRAAEALLDQYQQQAGADETLLSELASLYVQGAEVNWERLYAGHSHRKVHLPVYQFERTRCWVDIPEHVAEPPARLDSLYYRLTWKPGPVSGVARQRTGTAVLLGGPSSPLCGAMAERLAASGMDVISVQLGAEYGQLAENRYTVGGSEMEYQRFLAAIKEKNPSLILFIADPEEPSGLSSLEQLQESMERGPIALSRLVRAVAGSAVAQSLELFLVAPCVHSVTGGEATLRPEHGALFGLGKVITHEHPQIRCRAIDIDESTSADQLLAELAVESRSYVTAYRAGSRYVEVFEEVDPSVAPGRHVEVRPGGLYLITGGLGGIGLVMARHLASRAPVNLALVGRSPLPDRAEWDAILAASPETDLARRLAAVRELEAMGVEVICLAADVSRPEQMEPLIEDLRRRFGRIDGVIHAAGVVSPGVLIRKSEETFGEVLAPKVQGTWLLDRLTAPDDPDFFLLFSSAVTLTGEAGMGDYLSANYFLDVYAAYRNQGRRTTMAIDWVSWADAGMAVRFGINVDTLFKALPSTQAVEAFDQLLGRELDRVLVGAFNEGAYTELVAVAPTLPFDMSDRLRHVLDRIARGGGQVVSAVAGASSAFLPLSTRRKMERAQGAQQVTLVGRETEAYSDIEERVARIYGEVLGFSDINVYDSFFELGGDSILLSRMHEVLEQEFPGAVKLVELFDHTSVSKLSQHIQSKLQPKEPARPVVDLDAELSNLLDAMQAGNISVDEALKSLKKLDE